MDDPSTPTPVTQPVTIGATPGGPFMVEGSVAIRTASPVVSEKGEPMTWQPGAASLEDSPALCRCGHSGDKPFCDGSHADADWDADDGVSMADGSFDERAKHIDGHGLTLLDEPSLCMHAGFCGTARTDVWELMDQTDDTGVRATVIRMVEKCPSGRLVNVIDGNHVEPSLPVEIGIVPGGPLWVTGGVPVTTASGEQLEVRNRVTLCRCGVSSTKPLCDGSHEDIDFDD